MYGVQHYSDCADKLCCDATIHTATSRMVLLTYVMLCCVVVSVKLPYSNGVLVILFPRIRAVFVRS